MGGRTWAASAIKAVLFAVSCFASCEMIGQSEISLITLSFPKCIHERLFASSSNSLVLSVKSRLTFLLLSIHTTEEQGFPSKSASGTKVNGPPDLCISIDAFLWGLS